MTGAHIARIGVSMRRTPRVIRSAARRRDGFAIFASSVLGYLVVYLWAIGDLAFRGSATNETFVVDRPLDRMFETAPGAFSFEPIALVEFGIGTFLFSPFNTGIGLVLGILVGINTTLSYLAIRQPRSCGLAAGSGVLAAIPALLAGSACCAPAILIVLGIVATGTLLTILPLLLPIGFVLLVASLVYLAGHIDPTVLDNQAAVS